MPIGYTPTAKGNVSLTFPYIADEYRTLGHENYPNAPMSGMSIETSGDHHGWGADANRMAMAKVQATRTAHTLYDRTPRFRIQPSGNTAQMPLFMNKDESMSALRKWTGGALSGGGTAGALTTPEGQRYKRRILDARMAQYRNQLQGFETAPAPQTSHEKELTDKEARLTQSNLEFANILNQFQSGDNDFLRLGSTDLQKWLNNFYKLLPYYDSNDVSNLVGIDRALDEIWDEDLGSLQFEGLRNQFKEILKEYMKVINLQLPERIQATKTILRQIGLNRIAKGVIHPTPQELVNEIMNTSVSTPYNHSYPTPPSGGDGFDDHYDEYDPLINEETSVVHVPTIEQRDLPQYRTQAEITAEARRRLEDYRTPTERSYFDIAEEWSPFTNYHPRAGTAGTTIRRILVARIKQVLRPSSPTPSLPQSLPASPVPSLPSSTVGSGRRNMKGGNLTLAALDKYSDAQLQSLLSSSLASYNRMRLPITHRTIELLKKEIAARQLMKLSQSRR